MMAGSQVKQEKPFRPHSKVMRAQWTKEPGGQPRSLSSCKIISLKGITGKLGGELAKDFSGMIPFKPTATYGIWL